MNYNYLIPMFISFIIVSCYSCTGKKNYTAEEKEIVLIFNLPVPQDDTLFFGKGVYMANNAPVLTSNGKGKDDPIHLYEINSDTLVVKTRSDFSAIKYRYNPVISVEFIVEAGDSVLVEEKKGFPYLTVLNREYKDLDLNYDIHRIERNGLYGGFRNEDYFFHPEIFLIMGNSKNRKTIIDEYREKYLNEIIEEKPWLDSLRNNGSLSDVAYDYFSSRNKFVFQDLYLGGDSITKKEIQAILSNYDVSLLDNDAWGFESRYYFHAANKYYLMDGTKLQEAFDKISGDDLISEKMKLRLKLNWFHLIVNDNPLDVGEAYYNKLLTEITDTAQLSGFKARYGKIFNKELMNSDQLELSDKKGVRTTLSHVLQKHKGNVIYVDFWASWCQPCLAEMPESKKLRDEYRDKKVVFVYLALNENYNAWSKALGKAGLSDVEDCFLIENSRTASLLKTIKMTSIPRYLLFSPAGELEMADAPRPGSQEIRDILNLFAK